MLKTTGLEEKVIWCFWTVKNPLTDNRKRSLEVMRANSGCEVRLLTAETIPEYQLTDHPFHRAYYLLSATHRADYLRAYFMCHYGGGYADIKEIGHSWEDAWDELAGNPAAWCNGTMELGQHHVCWHPGTEYLKAAHRELLVFGNFVFRKGTPLASDWLKAVEARLDMAWWGLKFRDGSYHPRATLEGAHQAKLKPAGYPLRWNEIGGMLFHPLVYHYGREGRVLKTLPCFCLHGPGATYR